MDHSQNKSFGNWGEQVAVDTLVAAGCAIVERNWRMGHYEIDIIAQQGQYMIFVEVKTRSTAVADPLMAVDKRKRARLVAAADVFLRTLDRPFDYRFDIITIIGAPGRFTVEHFPDAFVPGLRTYR